VVDVDNVDNF